MNTIVDGIPVWGDPDAGAVEQMKRCMEHDDVVGAALMGDHHLGYAVPVGGVIAYGEHVSPSGVGFDIACIATGEMVTLEDGRRLPIEEADGALVGHHENRLGDMGPAIGRLVSIKPAMKLALSSGDTVTLTSDHLLLTPHGWAEAGRLVEGDRVAVSSWVGINDPVPPSVSVDLLRVAGFVAGDGHVQRGKKRERGAVCAYVFDPDDAADLSAMLAREGVAMQAVGVRVRPTGGVEHRIATSDPIFTGLVETLGIPVGKKVWDPAQLAWLETAPLVEVVAWLGGLWSADGETPRITHGTPQPPRLIQAGTNPAGLLSPVRAALERLGFESTIVSNPLGKLTLSVTGGWRKYVQFYRTVGFPLSGGRRRSLANYLSTAWAWEMARQEREDIKDSCRAERARGTKVREVAGAVSQQLGVAVSASVAAHAIYSGRGRARGWGERGQVDGMGEIAWANVERWAAVGLREVHDLALGHEAHNFVAGGVVVHNCGNKAVRVDTDARWLLANIGPVMDRVWAELSFGVGRKNAEAPDHALFQDDPAWDIPEVAELRDLARSQLGTIGSGNHYVDLFVDELDRVWIGVHFGSRGLGHKLATHYIKAGGGTDGIHVAPVVLHQDSPLGQEYIAAMTLAGRYAYAGRDWVCQRVASILGGEILEEVHNHHNYSWRETHGGRDVWVVRKGATPAAVGQRGFVGGTMGEDSVILEGTGEADGALTFESTVHGAGRAMSRTAAAGKWKGWGAKRHQVSRGAISQGMMDEWVARAGVTLRGAGVDESPHCYKRLADVLAAHGGSVRILHTLRPVGVAMAAAGEHDPYKD